MKKLLLFGGTFDPFHNGHLKMIDSAIHTSRFDKLVLVPNYLPTNKKTPKYSAEFRFQMLEKLTESLKNSSTTKVMVSDYEINQKRPCYSIDTVSYFLQTFPGYLITLLVGSDNFFSFHLWKDYKALLNKVSLLVVNRSKHDLGAYEDYIKSYLDTQLYKSLIILKNKPIEISSTQIRDNIEDSEYLKSNIPLVIYNELKSYD